MGSSPQRLWSCSSCSYSRCLWSAAYCPSCGKHWKFKPAGEGQRAAPRKQNFLEAFGNSAKGLLVAKGLDEQESTRLLQEGTSSEDEATDASPDPKREYHVNAIKRCEAMLRCLQGGGLTPEEARLRGSLQESMEQHREGIAALRPMDVRIASLQKAITRKQQQAEAVREKIDRLELLDSGIRNKEEHLANVPSALRLQGARQEAGSVEGPGEQPQPVAASAAAGEMAGIMLAQLVKATQTNDGEVLAQAVGEMAREVPALFAATPALGMETAAKNQSPSVQSRSQSENITSPPEPHLKTPTTRGRARSADVSSGGRGDSRARSRRRQRHTDDLKDLDTELGEDMEEDNLRAQLIEKWVRTCRRCGKR